MKRIRIPTFSLRDLCLSVAFVALVLAGLGWLNKAFSLNPASERVTVLGEFVELPWNETKWEPGHTGLSGNLQHMTSPASRVLHEPVDRFESQRLVSVAYDDYFGEERFNARVTMGGYFSRHYQAYRLDPFRSGGGSTDGGFACEMDFEAESMRLTLEIRQWLNRKRNARKATLHFIFEDGQFRYIKP